MPRFTQLHHLLTVAKIVVAKTLDLPTLPRNCYPLNFALQNPTDHYVSLLRRTFCTMLQNIGNITLSQLIFALDSW